MTQPDDANQPAPSTRAYDLPAAAAYSARWAAGFAFVVSVYAYWGTLGYGLLADARFLIADNALLRKWSDLPANVVHDYFWSSSGNQIPYWRPLTKASWLVEWLLGGGNPAVFHGVQVLWWALAAAGATLLAIELGAWPLWAGLAGVSVALHPAAAEPVSLIMARSDVVAVAGAVWSLYAFARWCASARTLWLIVSNLALVVALASKEASAGLAVVLTVWAWLGRRQGGATPRHWWRPIVPAWALTVMYLALRKGILGDQPGPSLVADPLRLAGGIGRYALGLVPGRLETGVINLPRSMVTTWQGLLPAVIALLIAGLWLAWAWRRRRPDAVMWVWLALSLAPVLLVEQLNVPGVEGKIPLADRWLLPAAVAMQVLLALALSRVRHRRMAQGVMIAWLVWIVGRTVMAPIDHEAYASELTLLDLEDRHLLQIPADLRSAQDLCRAQTRAMVRAGQSGNHPQVLAVAVEMPPKCREEPEPQFNLLAALVARGQMVEAAAVGRQLLTAPPPDRRFAAPMRALTGRALAETGHCEQANPLLAAAEQLGSADCMVPAMRGRCAQEAGQFALAGKHLEAAARCVASQGGQAAALWLMAADAQQQAGNHDDLLRDLEQIRKSKQTLPPALRPRARALGLQEEAP